MRMFLSLFANITTGMIYTYSSTVISLLHKNYARHIGVNVNKRSVAHTQHFLLNIAFCAQHFCINPNLNLLIQEAKHP